MDYGSNVTYTITPATGYHISDVEIDGVSQGSISSYVFTNVSSGHSIEAEFRINTYISLATLLQEVHCQSGVPHRVIWL